MWVRICRFRFAVGLICYSGPRVSAEVLESDLLFPLLTDGGSEGEGPLSGGADPGRMNGHPTAQGLPGLPS